MNASVSLVPLDPLGYEREVRTLFRWPVCPRRLSGDGLVAAFRPVVDDLSRQKTMHRGFVSAAIGRTIFDYILRGADALTRSRLFFL